MSMASVAAYVQNQQELIRSKRRQEAQVDAQLKAKYAACGQEDVYEPPGGEDEMASPVLINCTFNDEKSIQSIMEGIGNIVDGGDNDEAKPNPQEPKPKPKPVQPVQPRPQPNGMQKWVWPAIAAAGMGAGGLGLGLALGGDKDTQNQYDMRAIPYQPQETNQ